MYFHVKIILLNNVKLTKDQMQAIKIRISRVEFSNLNIQIFKFSNF